MQTYRTKTQHAENGTCMCCGSHIRFIEDHQGMMLFLAQTSAQRRGGQCMNCGQVACQTCNDRDCHCACGSNAWIALPYLEHLPNVAYV